MWYERIALTFEGFCCCACLSEYPPRSKCGNLPDSWGQWLLITPPNFQQMAQEMSTVRNWLWNTLSPCLSGGHLRYTQPEDAPFSSDLTSSMPDTISSPKVQIQPVIRTCRSTLHLAHCLPVSLKGRVPTKGSGTLCPGSRGLPKWKGRGPKWKGWKGWWPATITVAVIGCQYVRTLATLHCGEKTPPIFDA